jgi:hypothetical protein
MCSNRKRDREKTDMSALSPPDLRRINELIKQALTGKGDGVELAKLMEEGVQFWEQQDSNNLTDEQLQEFDKFNKMNQYVASHQLQGIDKALYG